MPSRFLPASCDRSAVALQKKTNPLLRPSLAHLDSIRAKVSSGRRVPFDPARCRGQPQSAAGHGGLHTAACGRHKGSSVHAGLISWAVLG